MDSKQLESVVQYLSGLVEMRPPLDRSDGELLRRFTARREEDAFAALVQRHGPLVLSVCRRVLRQEQDAEDAFQATFLVLARKAASIRREGSLASWLYGVACRTALRARTDAAKKVAWGEKQLPSQPDPPAEASLRELQQLLDEEVSLLPEKYRAPFVLCCLEGHSREEAARQLGWNKGTLSSRLALARQRLRERLARRGVTLSAALCAVALGPCAHAALPGALVAAATAAGMFSAGKTESTISVQAATLAEGVLRAMSLKIKVVALVLLVLAVAGAGAGLCVLGALPGKPPEAERSEPMVPGAPERDKARVDRYGDALPARALARLGTVRFRGEPFAPGLAFLAGDRALVNAGQREVTLWDVTTGKELHRLADKRWNSDGVLSADGKVLAVSIRSADTTTIHLLETATGKELHRLEGHPGYIRAKAFSADGRTLASADWDRGVWIWDTATGKEVRRFPEGPAVHALALTPDGKTLATTTGNTTVHLRETATGKELHNFPVKKLVSQLLFAPDGKTLAAVGIPFGNGASELYLWDTATGKLRQQLDIPEHNWRAAFSPDGRTLCTAHHAAIRLWDVASGKQLKQFAGNSTHTIGLTFSGDGKTLATSADGTLRLWEVATGKELPAPGEGHQGPVRALAFLEGGKTLVSAGGDGTLRYWEAVTGKELRCFSGAGSPVFSPSFAVNGKVVSAPVDNEVCLRELATGKELRRFRYPDYVRYVSLTPDDKTLAVFTGGEDKTLRLVDTQTGKERLARRYPQMIQVLDFSPAGDVLAIGLICDRKTLPDGSVRLLDAATGNELHRLHLTDNGTAFAFSADGKTLATPDLHGIVRLWEVATGKERAQLTDLDYPALAFSPDGRVLAVGEKDGTIRLCLAATGKELCRLPGHRSQITHFAFSADGKMLASGSWDTTILVWDVADVLERKGEPPAELAARQLESFWSDLAGDDAIKAYRAIQELASAPGQTVPFLKEHLRPVSKVEPKQIAALLAELDSNDFQVRDRATAALEKLAEPAEPALRKALEGGLSPESRRRVEGVLEKLRAPLPGPERLREMRALEVLEQVAGMEARKLLAELAQGAPEARLTRDARAALDRRRE
jgi:RNA polymerase sigma factor (sigma-70 family)